MARKNKKISCAIIIIGNEILSGRTKDQNVSYLASWLNNNLGIKIEEVRIVPDIEKEIIKTSSAVKNKIINEKNNVAKIRWVLDVKEIRTVTEEEAFPANKPRYSYWSGQK